MISTCGVCYNMTEQQIDSLDVKEFKRLCEGLAFIKEPMNWEPVKHVTVNDRRYRFVYDVRQIHAARYIEVKQYGATGLVPNMHRMAASMVVPQRKRKVFGRVRSWEDDTYNAAHHEQYAEDMLVAPITAIHGSAVFFCKLLANSINYLKDYLTQTMSPTQKTALLSTLESSYQILAGNTRPS